MSSIFSSRLRSSSKIDFFERTDLTMSDGGSSCTSRSRNLCRYEDEPVVAWEEEEVEADPADSGDCIGCAAGW